MVLKASYAWGVSRAQGQREYQEDRHVIAENFCMGYSMFAVLDGHGGSEVVDFCASNLAHITRQALLTQGDMNIQQALVRAFEAVHRALDSALSPAQTAMCGCTCVMLLLHDNHLWVANCGDSRAIMGSRERGKPVIALSEDHKPNSASELRRIRSAGGDVHMIDGIARVSGGLAVSRSLGDKRYAPFVIPLPDVTYHPLQADSAYVLLASDGLWDVMSSEEVHAFVTQQRTNAQATKSASFALLDYAYKHRAANDNMTVVLCTLDRSRSAWL